MSNPTETLKEWAAPMSDFSDYRFDGPYPFCGDRRVGIVTPDGEVLYLYQRWPAWWADERPGLHTHVRRRFQGPDTPEPDDIRPLERKVSNLPPYEKGTHQ